ncbi:unnamed protein product [Nesidiocoris tenuis]|uniref:Uncharacterized protein n=1 Tax=Nesidiocoris tenuis TaxID=355587 RepID=A0A6H5GXW3_9HEMI|nr:unnamed protein product [Nesidiocoris tenuis]
MEPLIKHRRCRIRICNKKFLSVRRPPYAVRRTPYAVRRTPYAVRRPGGSSGSMNLQT